MRNFGWPRICLLYTSKAGLSVQTLIALCDILEITPNYVLLPDAARVLEEPIGPLLKGMSQRQLQDVEEMVRIFVRNGRHEEKCRPRGGRRNMPVSYTHLDVYKRQDGR